MNNMPIWVASINRWHDQTGVAHVATDSGLLCGARPYSTGGGYRAAEDTGAHECRNCRRILSAVTVHRVTLAPLIKP